MSHVTPANRSAPPPPAVAQQQQQQQQQQQVYDDVYTDYMSEIYVSADINLFVGR